MIKAENLRIGNFIEWEGKYYRVRSLAIFGVRHIGIEFPNSDTILGEEHANPIPLSPEILEKCGLAKSNEFEMWYGFNHHLCVEKIHGGWLWCIDDTGNNEGSKQRELKYLHHLQNIVYFTFGEELQIQL